MEILSTIKLVGLLSILLTFLGIFLGYGKSKFKKGYLKGVSDTLKSEDEIRRKIYEETVKVIDNPDKPIADVVQSEGAQIVKS